ncbi:MAG TPA: tetratricopeptide repeat protein [Pyrinomonadaceae bacterium]|jgi:Tfp pilus assembly protein PilF|nr:tetratricopeptide repeat protein [Pyrinomonadaceae bacterium]
MKRLTPRVFAILSALAALLLASHDSPCAYAAGGDEVRWVSVRSQNFTVVGEAREKDLRRVAVRLEEFRSALARLIPDGPKDAGAPTTVVVFRDDAAYQPFKPVLRGQTASYVAGYFQPGAEVNYITLALDSDWSRGPASTLLHEYTHLLVNNYFRHAPLWLKEGLAEFYSTARLSKDRRRVWTGAELPGRVRQLRGAQLIPLRTLFEVEQDSPYYYESGKRGLFYAQSWALAHFILNGDGGARRARLPRFVELLASGVAPPDAFRQAFGFDADEAEGALAAYVRLGLYAESSETYARPLDFDSQLRATPMPPAEGLALLGDLLLHTDRVEESEGYLTRSLALDPALARARVSLGLLRLRQNRPDDARAELALAAHADPRNHLAHYLLAESLNRGAGEAARADRLTVKDFEERTEQMRAALRRAIELAPDFPEGYRLLATIEMERADRPDEAIALLRRASALAPRRHDLVLLTAQAYLFKGAFDEARRLAEPVAMHSPEPRMREQAVALLQRIDAREQTAELQRSRADEAARLEASADAALHILPCDMPLRGGPQYKRLRFEGEQTCGRLVSIECDDVGVTLRVESADNKTLQLHADDLRSIRFVTYTAAVKTGRLTCGPRERAEQVLVTYRPKRNQQRASDGEALAVEFVPEDWNH